MQSGVLKIQAQERIVFGTPAPEAVIADREINQIDELLTSRNNQSN